MINLYLKFYQLLLYLRNLLVLMILYYFLVTSKFFSNLRDELEFAIGASAFFLILLLVKFFVDKEVAKKEEKLMYKAESLKSKFRLR